MSDGMLLLSWNSHHVTFCDILSRLREKGSFTDVTLACEGKFYSLHKLVLSTCSEYLEQIFEKTPCKHPVIVLNDMKCSELEALLSYMYAGEVSVPQSTLPLLIKAAELLQVKGLAVPDTPPSTSKKKVSACNLGDDPTSPQAKRRKYEESDTTSHRGRSQGSSNSPSTTSSPHSKESSYASEHSNTLSEDIEQEQLDQVVDQLQASEGSSLGHVENVYAETDIKEEVVDDVDNTNSMVVCVPELDYPSHRSSCKMEDTRGESVTKDVCSLPLSEDYEKQPLDSQGIFPPPTNVPDLAVSSTELQGWMVEGALGELSRVDGYSGTGFLESSSPMTTPQGTPQQEQQMVKLNTNGQRTGGEGKKNGTSTRKKLEYPYFSYMSSDPSLLIRHIITRNGDGLYSCTQCPYQCESEKTLKLHQRTHYTFKPHCCPHCQYRSAKKYNLQIHIRSHTGEKPFSCPHCPFRSTNRSDLRKHIHTHRV